jgi:hypothetical protein
MGTKQAREIIVELLMVIIGECRSNAPGNASTYQFQSHHFGLADAVVTFQPTLACNPSSEVENNFPCRNIDIILLR